MLFFLKKVNKFEIGIIILIVFFVTTLFILNELYTNFETYRSFKLNLSQIITIPIVTTGTGIALMIFLISNTKLRNKRDLSAEKLQQTPALIQTLLLILILFSSFWVHLTGTPTTFGLPQIDMGPFYERQVNINFAPNDFFTNVSTLPSPRHIYGHNIIILTKIFDTDWYTILYGLYVFFTLTLPSLFFLNIATVLRKRISNDERYIFGLFIAFIFTVAASSAKVAAAVSIGWWGPQFLGPAAQTLSIFLGLLFSLLVLRTKSGKVVYFLIPILFVSTLVHPAAGLFSFIFFILLDLDKDKVRFYLTSFLAGIGSAFVIISLLFKSKVSFSATEFIHYYILEQHRRHYLVSDLSTFTNIPWYIIFSAILFILIVLFLIGIKTKDSYLRKASTLFISAYAGAVAIQYVFIEIFPLKGVAILGPIRFSMFGYWLLALGLCYLVAQYIPINLVPRIREHKLFSKNILVAFFIIIFLLLFLAGLNKKDDPKHDFEIQHPELTEWIESNTTTADVFAVFPNFPPTSVPLLLNRGVFAGNGFPFTEDAFVEYEERNRLIFGSESERSGLPGLLPGGTRTSYYRTLLPSDFVKSAELYQLDFVAIEAKHSNNFSEYKPLFEDDFTKIYAVKDLINQ